MQNNDAIETVAPLGGGISEVAVFPDAAAVLASTAGVLVEPNRSSASRSQLQHSRSSGRRK
jgi:hypothetical protein